MSVTDSDPASQLDTPTIHRVIANSLPQLDDQELLDFLTSVVHDNLPACLESADHLAEVLCEHLISFECCENLQQCAILCNMLFDSLLDPPALPTGDDQAESDETALMASLGLCEMCGRDMPRTFHHLVPKSMHKKVLKREGCSKQDLHKGALICRPCHSAIHRLIPLDQMAYEYRTLDRILERDDVQKWLAYAVKQRTVPKQHAKSQLRYRR